MGRREPAFLTEVMDTIASFRDSKGSPPDKILDRIISQRKAPLKNASLQVKKALKTGLKTGLLKEVGGKFKLGLGSKDYAIFKSFRQLEKGGSNLPVKEMRRRRSRRGRSKRGRSRRRRRGRRRSEFFDADLGLTPDKKKGFSLLKLPNHSNLPVKEVRRRRKKTRRSRRRRRGRRRSDILTIDGVELDNETDTEPVDRGRRRRRRRGKKRSRRGRRRVLEDEGDPTSDDSKAVSGKSSEEKPKPGHGDNRTPAEKRDIVPDPPRGRLDNESASDHCIHSYHHDTNHYGNPPHYGYE